MTTKTMTATETQAVRAETMEALLGRSAEDASIPNKMVNDLEGIAVDIRSSDESTIHPANGLLMRALQNYSGSSYLVHHIHTIDPCSHMVDCWVAKLEKDAELIRRGEKGRKYIFLLNNTYGVRQMAVRPGASFASDELASRLSSMIERYKKSYLEECWVPLQRLNSDEFTAEFLAICNRQMTWKVTAELRYQLRREILKVFVPPYELPLSANESRVIEGLFEG